MQVACASISVSDLEHPPVLSTSALPTWVFEMGNGELPTWNFELGNCPLAFWSGQCRAIAHHDFSGLVLALRGGVRHTGTEVSAEGSAEP